MDALIEKPSLRVLILAGSAIAAGLGLIALAGWLAGIPRLASLVPGLKPMAPDTALLFTLNGAAILLFVLLRGSRLVYFTCMAAGSLTIIVALPLFFLSVLNKRPGIEHLGIPIRVTEVGSLLEHMSSVTALCFTLAGISLLAALSASPRRLRPTALARWLSGLVIGVGFVLLLSYILGGSLFNLGPLMPSAVNSSLGFTALGCALFVFAGLRIGPLPHRTEPAVPGASILILVFAVMAAGITAAGYWYARSDENRYRAQVEHGLSAVAELKVGELLQWRSERLGDGEVFHDNLNFAGLVRRAFAAPADRETQERLRTWLLQTQAAYQYDRVFLLDAQGVERLSVPGKPEATDSVIADQASAALRIGKVVFQDFYRGEHDLRVYLAVLVPLRDPQTSSEIGVLGLRIDPERYIYPLINRWPTPSRSAETLLIRREGNEAVFLNELRFRKGSALTLRSPLANERMTAVQAVLGRTGIVQGIDYRGVPVVADVRPVPGSPWFVVARMDVSEIYGPLREKRWLLILLAGALIIGAATAVGLVYGNQRARFYRDRYQAAEALRESEERYRLILDSLSEGFQIIGRDWRYLYLNEAAAQHGRRVKEELLGRAMMECYPGIEKTPMFAVLRTCMEERTPQRVENEFAYPDGSKAWFELIIQPAGEGIFVLSLDVSKRKQAEEQIQRLNAELEQRVIERTSQLEAANKELEAFAYSVSHDLRAPLRAIDGFSRIILEDYAGRLDAEGNRFLTVVRTNTQKMDQLITDLLALSRAARTELQRARIDMSTMAASIYHELVPPEEEGNFQFSVSPLPDAWGDPTLMRQVWANLIGNAVKFTRPKEARSIEISGRREQEMNVYSVKDNGVGFDPAYAHKLFGIFQRLHRSEEFEGTGVGLAIVQRIIHRHGGRLWAEGKVNEGATFHFCLRNEEDKDGSF